MNLSVILCTYNPRRTYLERTLGSVRDQGLGREDWELVIVDNNSDEPVAEHVDLSWHPRGWVVVEREQGLTAARLRGIAEASGELLVFIDDDNVLQPTYLHEAWRLHEEKPWLGAYGGGISGEYEMDPPVWALKRCGDLAVREVKEPVWICVTDMRALHFAPCGAGMVIKRIIAQHYARKLEADPLRKRLDRSGASLASAGDSDLAFCACELGYAVGLFPELQMTHLIPRERIEQEYLIRLAEGMAKSHALLKYIWEGRKPDPAAFGGPGFSDRIFEGYKAFRMRLRGSRPDPFDRAIEGAEKRGRAAAIEVIQTSSRENQ